MICTNCKTSFAQHELENELCLRCTAKELEAVRQQHAEALARERVLREALEKIARDDGFGHDNLCDIAEAALDAPAPRVFTAEG